MSTTLYTWIPANVTPPANTPSTALARPTDVQISEKLNFHYNSLFTGNNYEAAVAGAYSATVTDYQTSYDLGVRWYDPADPLIHSTSITSQMGVGWPGPDTLFGGEPVTGALNGEVMQDGTLVGHFEITSLAGAQVFSAAAGRGWYFIKNLDTNTWHANIGEVGNPLYAIGAGGAINPTGGPLYVQSLVRDYFGGEAGSTPDLFSEQVAAVTYPWTAIPVPTVGELEAQTLPDWPPAPPPPFIITPSTCTVTTEGVPSLYSDAYVGFTEAGQNYGVFLFGPSSPRVPPTEGWTISSFAAPTSFLISELVASITPTVGLSAYGLIGIGFIGGSAWMLFDTTGQAAAAYGMPAWVGDEVTLADGDYIQLATHTTAEPAPTPYTALVRLTLYYTGGHPLGACLVPPFRPRRVTCKTAELRFYNSYRLIPPGEITLPPQTGGPVPL